MNRADKQKRKDTIKRIRRVKGRGQKIPPNRVIPNKKQDIIEKLIDKENN